MLKLAGLPKDFASTKDPDYGGLCLTLTEYLQTLYIIHRKGLQLKLDRHFLPQHLRCFRHVPPSEWTLVITIANPQLPEWLEQVLVGKESTTLSANQTNSVGMVRSHASGHSQQGMGLSPMDGPLLDAITRDEYQVLGPFL